MQQLALRGVRIEVDLYEFDRVTNRLTRSALLDPTVEVQPVVAGPMSLISRWRLRASYSFSDDGLGRAIWLYY